MKFFTKKGTFSWLIVGLGNPGMQYENTRHNAGFIAVDAIAERYKTLAWKSEMKAYTAQCDVNGIKVLLIKPQTYMNNSGEAVKAIASYYRMPADKIIVIFDDISLPVGRIRIRRNGSDGGHNGMKDIIELMGTDMIPRIKVGIGAKPHPQYDLKDWVLSKFNADEKEMLDFAIKNVTAAIDDMTFGDFDTPMNKFNKK